MCLLTLQLVIYLSVFIFGLLLLSFKSFQQLLSSPRPQKAQLFMLGGDHELSLHAHFI